MLDDLRYSLRTLAKSSRFSALAIVALALGIGAASSMFSVVDGVLLEPLPYRDPDRLVVVQEKSVRAFAVAPANFEDWKAQNHVFSSIAAAVAWGADLTGVDQPEQIKGMRVSPGMFPLLGVSPMLGRSLLPEDGNPQSRRAVVLSYALWQRRFGGDPGALGRVLTLNGEDYAVVGVMPPGFRFAPFWVTNAEIWAAILQTPEERQNRGAHMLRVFARLNPGVSVEQAQAEMSGIAGRLEQAWPRTNTGSGAEVKPLSEMVVGGVRRALLILLGAVGCLLLIACVNVANLLLARASGRRREIAVRLALGAGRGRLVRQLLCESAVLGLAGGALGLLLAFWVSHVLATEIPGQARFHLPRQQEIGIRGAVLAFTLLVSLATSLLFGLAPALAASRAQLYDALKQGGRGLADARSRFRAALVVAEMALALVLLAGAGLLLRSYQNLHARDAGFHPANVWTMAVSTAGSRSSDPVHRARFYRELLDRARSLPGVESASEINHPPLTGDIWSMSFVVEDRALPAPGNTPNAVWRVIRPRYFQTMGIRLEAGRDFTEQDIETSPAVVIVNRTMARRFWGSADPIGKRVRWGDAESRGAWRTIVGVVADVEQWEWAAPRKEEMYVPFWQDFSYQHDASPWFSMTLVARASSHSPATGSALRQAVWAIDRNVPVVSIDRMEDVIANATWQPRFSALLLGVFAALALLLAAVGIYGVISYAVSRRTREIGIRMALGARPANVLRLVIRQGMRLVLFGILLGLAGALALTRLLSSLLYQVSVRDPLALLGATLLLAAVALIACFLPALRAVRVQPALALHDE